MPFIFHQRECVAGLEVKFFWQSILGINSLF